jgi:hypothetical protein
MNFRTVNPTKCRAAGKKPQLRKEFLKWCCLVGPLTCLRDGTSWVWNNWQEKTEVLRENSDSLPFCPLQIPLRFPWNGIRASEVGNWQLSFLLHKIVQSSNCLPSLRARGLRFESWSFIVDLLYSISSIFVSVGEVKHLADKYDFPIMLSIFVLSTRTQIIRPNGIDLLTTLCCLSNILFYS